jgi:hypothetical protein
MATALKFFNCCYRRRYIFLSAVGDGVKKFKALSPSALIKIIFKPKQNYILCLIFKRCWRQRFKMLGNF